MPDSQATGCAFEKRQLAPARFGAGRTQQATAGVRDLTSPQHRQVLHWQLASTVASSTGRPSGSALGCVPSAQGFAELVLEAGAFKARLCPQLPEHHPDLAFFEAEVS
jgi:hypothetical protein